MVFGVRYIKDIFLCIISKTLENQEPQKKYGVCQSDYNPHMMNATIKQE